MPRFLIEMTHEDEHDNCVRALDAVRLHGSHLITRIEWGCKAGVHSGWIIAECDSVEEAKMLVPPELRHETRVVQLDRFTPEEIQAWAEKLDG